MTALLGILKKINDLLLHIETLFMGVITAFLVICIFIEVICRYFFFISVPWAEEIARYLFIWLTYIGSAYAVYYGQHTEIDILQQIFDKRKENVRKIGTRYIKIAAIASTMIFQLIFAKIFWDYMMIIFESTQTSPTMHIPMGLVYLPVFIGTVMAALHCVYMFIFELSGNTDEDKQISVDNSSVN